MMPPFLRHPPSPARRNSAPDCEVGASPHIPSGRVVVSLKTNPIQRPGKLSDIMTGSSAPRSRLTGTLTTPGGTDYTAGVDASSSTHPTAARCRTRAPSRGRRHRVRPCLHPRARARPRRPLRRPLTRRPGTSLRRKEDGDHGYTNISRQLGPGPGAPGRPLRRVRCDGGLRPPVRGVEAHGPGRVATMTMSLGLTPEATTLPAPWTGQRRSGTTCALRPATPRPAQEAP